MELERSDFFQIKALGLKKANILEQRGAAAPLARPLDTPLILSVCQSVYRKKFLTVEKNVKNSSLLTNRAKAV